MNLPFRFALRYLFSKKSTNAINVLAGISVVGMTVGAFALVVLLSVFNGFESLVVSLYDVFNADIEIKVKEGKTFVPADSLLNYISTLEGVRVVSEVVEENAYLTYDDKEFIATIKGVDDNYLKVSGLDSFVVYGSSKLTENENNFAIIGAGIDMALDINVDQAAGPINIIVPKRGKKSTIIAEDAFRRKFIMPGGVFTIQQEFDAKYTFVPLDFARDLLQLNNEVSSLELHLEKGADLQRIKKSVVQFAGNDFVVKDKFEQKEVLYRVMRMERWAVYMILSFILLIISFNIIGSLSMLVMEKSKDILILNAMGADSTLIKRIFLSEGILMSVLGGLEGLRLGFIFCLLQMKFGFIKIPGSGSFLIDAYPIVMKYSDFLLILVTIVMIGIIASWIPSKKAGVKEMLLRYE